MKCKRLLTLVLAAALAVSMALPAGAAKSSFSDINDQTTAVNADVLRLMGVVDGVGGDRFEPGSSLTRAQFCTMVVKFMQKGDEVANQATRAIFSDVTARHWALGYVNLAASTTVADGDKSAPLISGVGNGRFEPDSQITFAQATTILIRVLGYSSSQVGAVWPQSYMNKAASLGLTDGVKAGYNDTITRAQAAQLFVNALSCKTGGGSAYYSTLGTVSDGAVLLAVNVRSDDGEYDSAVRTSEGTYLPHAEGVKPTGLQGKRGALVVNDKKELVTFVPDDSSSVTLTLSGSAQPSYVKGTDGKQYAVSSSTPVYTSDKTESSTYLTKYAELTSGTQITLFSERGKVVAVYAATGTSTDTDAIVVTGSASAAMFLPLTGTTSGYTILKGRQSISMGDIKPYDVVTYDSMNNALVVSDLRLTCVYEDAAPNAKAPETVTVLGQKFTVLESAWDTTRDFNVGDTVTLLLTSDGKVAGMAKSSARSNAVGIADSGSVTVFRPDGGTIKLSGTLSSDSLEGQLVAVSSSSKGRITINKVSSSSAGGDLNVSKMTLGGRVVLPSVRIYEQVGSNMAEVQLSALSDSTVAAKDIAACHLNTSGMVDFIVLKSITGDAYTYGRLTEGAPVSGGSIGGLESSNATVIVTNHGGSATYVCAFNYKQGGFGGVAPGGDFNGTPKAASLVELTEIKKVSPSDFFQAEGVTYLRSGSKTYRVADGVECYKAVTKTWFDQDSGTDRLSACRAFSSDLTVYVDPIGEKVRIVVAN